jgi:hypothetical protein
MAGTWTSERFPQFEREISRLTEQHRELQDEPLHLAVAYLPAARDQQDIFLFEVVGGALTTISSDRNLFEATFTSTPGFRMGANERLHLVLTNPDELRLALEQGWPLAQEVVNAIRANDYHTMYADDVGNAVLSQLQAAARRELQEAAVSPGQFHE